MSYFTHSSGPTGMSRPIIYTKRDVYLTAKLILFSPEHCTWQAYIYAVLYNLIRPSSTTPKSLTYAPRFYSNSLASTMKCRAHGVADHSSISLVAVSPERHPHEPRGPSKAPSHPADDLAFARPSLAVDLYEHIAIISSDFTLCGSVHDCRRSARPLLFSNLRRAGINLQTS